MQATILIILAHLFYHDTITPRRLVLCIAHVGNKESIRPHALRHDFGGHCIVISDKP
jgi:site-specific recombinase XerC